MIADMPPTIIICGGSYHLPTHYAPLITALENLGFEVRCPALPTMQVYSITSADAIRTNFDPEPPSTPYPNGYDDAAVVRNEIRSLVDEGKRVILIGHSYGGWLSTESASREFKYKPDQGDRGGVVGIFYIAGFSIPVGESIDSFFSPQGDETPPPPFVKLGKHVKKGIVTPQHTEEYFFHDALPEVAKEWASTLRVQPVIKSVLNQASYADFPCGYLLCQQDRVFPVEIQEMMVNTSITQGGKITKWNVDGGHVPFVAQPDVVARKIAEYVATI